MPMLPMSEYDVCVQLFCDGEVKASCSGVLVPCSALYLHTEQLWIEQPQWFSREDYNVLHGRPSQPMLVRASVARNERVETLYEASAVCEVVPTQGVGTNFRGVVEFPWRELYTDESGSPVSVRMLLECRDGEPLRARTRLRRSPIQYETGSDGSGRVLLEIERHDAVEHDAGDAGRLERHLASIPW